MAGLRRCSGYRRATGFVLSPTKVFKGNQPCRSFTAAGIVSVGEPYKVDMGGGFQPWRRDVRWSDTQHVPIAPSLGDQIARRGRQIGAISFVLG